MIKKTVFIASTAAAFLAWGGSWDSIKKTTSTIKTVKAEFVQKKQMKILSAPLVSTGSFYFKAPRSLRWEYMKPMQSILLMHNGSVSRHVKRGGILIEDHSAQVQSMQIVLQEISLWLKGEFEANRTFKAELKHGGIIEMTPRDDNMSRIISRIRLKLSNKPGIIQSVTIYESPDSYTLIEFSKSTVNEDISDGTFKKT